MGDSRSAGSPDTAGRLNILWISLEDCSPRFGCYGDAVARTPNIDRLASEGTLYRHAFCTAPVCSPSRTTIITGFPSTAMAAQHMRTTYQDAEFPSLPTPYFAVPPPHVKCFTEFLRAAGYYCSNNGKTDYQFESPFLAWDADGKPPTVDEIHWRNRPDPAQPFFAVFNLEDTHESRMWDGSAPRQEGDSRPNPSTDPAEVVVPPYLPDTQSVRVAIARQHDNIAHNDAIVGKILAQLAEDGLADSTVVMLWADHGEGLPRGKRFLYDSGTRVPLIIRWPGRIGAGLTDDRLVSLIDLAPTVLEAAGLTCPAHIEGHSLLQPAGRAYAFAHRDRLDSEYDKARSARSIRYNYIRNYHPGRERFGFMPYRGKHGAMQPIRLEQLRGNRAFDRPCPAEELYDVEADPCEMTNLIDRPEFQKIRQEHSEALKEWQRDNDPDRDLGEEQMVGRLWPQGCKPVTAAPLAAIYTEENPEGAVIDSRCEVAGPALLQLACATEGASIGFRFDGSPAWKLYESVQLLPPGDHCLYLKAVRYGYGESEEQVIRISVRA